MASTFGILNSAYSGLTAAKAALDTAGQNIANVDTEGYVRQRVQQVSIPGSQTPALFSKGASVGAGVAVIGITRLNDTLLDSRVRDTASTSGYWNAASSSISSLETTLNEPGTTGLSSSLNDFWASWSTMANGAGSTSAASSASVVIAQGQLLASQLRSGYAAAENGWNGQLSATAGAVATINSTAQQIASLNKAILQTTSSGGNPNDLMDQRDAALKTLSQLAGASTRQNSDGTIDVLVGGNALVAETSARSLTLVGATAMAGAATDPVRIQWAGTGSPASIEGGSVAAQLATLAGPSNGTGGVYAEAAQVYNDIATQLAATVNTALAGGVTSSGAAGTAFFTVTGTPAGQNLTVTARSVDDLPINSPTGGVDGKVADMLSQQGSIRMGADDRWTTFVANVGVQSKNAATQSAIYGSAAAAAANAQTSQSGVDLDEETTNLVTFQHAYQAAARVMTTIDSVLDTLINHTGLTA